MKNTVVFDLEVVAETFAVTLIGQCVPGILFAPLLIVIMADTIFKYLVIDRLDQEVGCYAGKYRLTCVFRCHFDIS